MQATPIQRVQKYDEQMDYLWSALLLFMLGIIQGYMEPGEEGDLLIGLIVRAEDIRTVPWMTALARARICVHSFSTLSQSFIQAGSSFCSFVIGWCAFVLRLHCTPARTPLPLRQRVPATHWLQLADSSVRANANFLHPFIGRQVQENTPGSLVVRQAFHRPGSALRRCSRVLYNR